MSRTLLRTKVCDILGIEYPVLLAGMGPTGGGGRGSAATAPLVAAVSNAGGLGVLGGAGFNPDALREEIRKIRSLTEKPFGVDLLMPSNAVRVESSGNGSAADWRAQVPIVNAIFRPTPEAVEYARRVVEAHEEALQRGEGAVEIEGRMVDRPIAARARRLIGLATAIEAREAQSAI